MNRRNRHTVTFILLAIAGGLRAEAERGKTATLKVGKPRNKQATQIIISSKKGENYLDSCYVDIPAGISALEKAQRIYDTCNRHPFDIVWDGKTNKLRFIYLDRDTTHLEFDMGETAELPDEILEEGQWPSGRYRRIPLDKSRVHFANARFDPFDVLGQPAVFTAGIVTDVGELTARISAQELNFQTEGPIICQALYDRLAPRAPQYGAQINYAGDRLEIYFDPAYTVQRSGVVFGTTSPSPGCFALLGLPGFVNGDLNCDYALNNFDIDPFVLALTDPAGYAQQFPYCDRMLADVNGDGVVDNFDIDPFVKLLAP